MSPKLNVESPLLSVVVLSVFITASIANWSSLARAQPTASVASVFAGDQHNTLSSDGSGGGGNNNNQFELSKEAAEKSFKQFIGAKSLESTIIGQFEPNGSELDKMRLRSKIAGAIQSMKEIERQKGAAKAAGGISGPLASGAECYIEVTRVEKVAGKCHRAVSGLPICQSDNYMTISNECS